VSRYQKGKTNLDFTEARDSEWQWHQLGYMQVCTSLQTDNHASTPPLKYFTGRMPFLPPNQERQSTEGIPQNLKIQKKSFSGPPVPELTEFPLTPLLVGKVPAALSPTTPPALLALLASVGKNSLDPPCSFSTTCTLRKAML